MIGDKTIYSMKLSTLYFTDIFVYNVNERQASSNSKDSLYFDSIGAGSDLIKEKALEKALSEYIERKVFFSLKDSDCYTYSRFGFDMNPTTDGMAAHWWGFKARRNAKHEALERWTLHHWWNDLLSFERVKSSHPHRTILSKTYKQFNTIVVLICDYREESGFFYGFAAHKNFDKAYNKALVELDRNHRVLTYYNKKKPELSEFREKRVVYFSSPEGFSEFAKKVRKNESIKDLVFPEVYLDKEIPGPWQKWRRVWRVLFKQHIPQDYKNLNVFMF
ncbi:MAG: hypothetical protein COW00_19530 [Bdellovibrio sp. CG12_big_fil_rev_8_21_14_0_65_39_13]|nr:MAG: hypothetical protein COW78_03730 [Bdellovibrio sp. CG22_combo_CG10-13_8_21_14_all_39_27]PIQ57680.1 MAG: hypothetical protein COW00_19530 [Bdellovibrio sp. CG12_big_fil_rev_8_21_14_0_65_39_13]PIR35192.1 MAG: hypothetical protein COV37_09785 [Bdellovibrio sp. CG11_big_fil_rev_8_21_14_0_20_39_38]